MGTRFPRDQGIPSVLNDSDPPGGGSTRGAGGRVFAPSPGSRHVRLRSRGCWGCPCSCRRPRRRCLRPGVHECERLRVHVCASACMRVSIRVCMCARECVHECKRSRLRCERAVPVRWSRPREGRTEEGRDGGPEPGRGCSVLPGGVERKTGTCGCVSLAGTEQQGESPREVGESQPGRSRSCGWSGGLGRLHRWLKGEPVQSQETGLLVPAGGWGRGLSAHPLALALALAALSSDRWLRLGWNSGKCCLRS